jgi:hypothetical protein
VVVRRDEVEAALQARRELGKGYEDEIVDSLVEKIERRLDERRRPAPPAPMQHHHADPRVILGSLALGVGATAIASGNHVAWLAIFAWLAIAIVNLAYARRR